MSPSKDPSLGYNQLVLISNELIKLQASTKDLGDNTHFLETIYEG